MVAAIPAYAPVMDRETVWCEPERKATTERIPAGNVEFPVETRRAQGGADGGPSIHVRSTQRGEELQLLRFDCCSRPRGTWDKLRLSNGQSI